MIALLLFLLLLALFLLGGYRWRTTGALAAEGDVGQIIALLLILIIFVLLALRVLYPGVIL